MPDPWMDGVYPNMKDSRLLTREGHLKRLLKEASRHFSKIYPELTSPESLAKYLERLNPKTRELFLEVSIFINILYNELNAVPPFLKDAVAIVAICSLIEKLQSKRGDYVPLVDWLKSEATAKQLEELIQQEGAVQRALNVLVDKYNSHYGSREAIVSFFHSHLLNEDKRSLIRSYCRETECIENVFQGSLKAMTPGFRETMTIGEVKAILKDRIEVRKAFLPLCYGSTCYVDYGRCHPNVSCRLGDDRLMQDILRRVVSRLLYAYRNRFVHKARLPILAPELKEDAQTFYSAVFDHIDGKLVKHTLEREFLLRAFAVSLKRFFDKSETVEV